LKRRLPLILLCAALAAGCSKGPPRPDAPAPRAVTYSPALTALVFQMGLGDHVVGVTKYCRLPAGETRVVVGDEVAVRAEKVLAVRPDVILIQQSPDDFAPVRRMAPDVRIEHFTIETLDAIPAAMKRIGEVLDAPEAGRRASEAFAEKLAAARRLAAGRDRPRVLFVMGYKTPSSAGKGTFIHEMIEAAGGENIVAEKYTGWKQPTIDYVVSRRPEVIVCQADEPTAAEAKAYWLALEDLPAARNGRVFVVTDPGWTVPSARLADLTVRLAEMISGAGGPQP
jgi:iron complex transport system substrate-binding protein